MSAPSETTNKSYRTDETYIEVKGEDKYLYGAVDSTGQTIDFLLTAKRDAAAAKRFFRMALRSPGNPIPRVINEDMNPAVPPAVEALKAEGNGRTGGREVRAPKEGQYVLNVNPAKIKRVRLDRKVRLELYEARNAVQIARWTGASQYAPPRPIRKRWPA